VSTQQLTHNFRLEDVNWELTKLWERLWYFRHKNEPRKRRFAFLRRRHDPVAQTAARIEREFRDRGEPLEITSDYELGEITGKLMALNWVNSGEWKAE
jgi:hypothetical protein